jgi:hypothetical protein
MNRCDHSELFDALAELRRRYPEWRLGQLIANVAGWADQDVWEVQDDELLAAAKEHLHALAQRKQEAGT